MRKFDWLCFLIVYGFFTRVLCWYVSTPFKNVAWIFECYIFDSLLIAYAGWENSVCSVLFGGASKDKNIENLWSIWGKLLSCTRRRNKTEATNARSMLLNCLAAVWWYVFHLCISLNYAARVIVVLNLFFLGSNIVPEIKKLCLCVVLKPNAI